MTLAETAEVRVLSRAGDSVGTIAVGVMPAQIAASADGRVAVVANRRSGSMSVLDPAALTELRRIPLPGALPHGIALDPSGGIAYVTYEGRVSERGGVVAVRTGTGEVLWQREAGVYTLGVAYHPGSGRGN